MLCSLILPAVSFEVYIAQFSELDSEGTVLLVLLISSVGNYHPSNILMLKYPAPNNKWGGKEKLEYCKMELPYSY